MPDAILDILNRYTNFSIRNDGAPEIKSLRYAPFEKPDYEVPSNGRLALVLIEPRILQPIAGLTADDDLLPRLERWKGDLRAEGLFSRFILVDLYPSVLQGVPKDGSQLLAIRRVLKDIKAAFANFEGVVLVGAFPEASLMTRWLWSRSPNSLGGYSGKFAGRTDTALVCYPERVSNRSEIVLADLTGNWEALYQFPGASAAYIIAFPDDDTKRRGWWNGKTVLDVAFTSTSEYETGFISFNDCFYFDDANYTRNQITGDRLSLTLRSAMLNQEVGASDRVLPNPLARPDIAVSRINGRNVAANPDPSLRGDDGQGFLDAYGNPRTFTSRNSLFEEPQYLMFTYQDPKLERQLYNTYFDRNHRFRVGAWSNLPFRTGAIAPPRIGALDGFNANDGASLINQAASDFSGGIVQNNATLLDYVRFLKQPSVLRHIMAHSSTRDSLFSDTYSLSDLETEIGGQPVRWTREAITSGCQNIQNEVDGLQSQIAGLQAQLLYVPTQAKGALLDQIKTLQAKLPAAQQRLKACMNVAPFTYRPSMAGQGIYANLFLHRALWRNNTLRDAGAALVIHGGCNVNSVDDTENQPYSSVSYAAFQNGEGILFFTNTAALLSRAKEFYDPPDGFPQAFRTGDRANFGGCWLAYFNARANDASVNGDNAVWSKRAYWWSMMGDWTLRLRNKNGLGLLRLDGALQSAQVHPHHAWVDGWNFDGSIQSIRGAADLDGDGRDEVVITSDWGIGILRHDGKCWRAILAAPRDTWFGSWHYDATVNSGRDQIQGIANYTGGRAAEILVTSSWGVGVLALNGNTLTTASTQANGTRLGDWVFNSTQNNIRGSGDFDGDGCCEALVTSDWGIGILSFQSNRAIFLAPNGTRFGGWLLSTQANTIRLIADIDGDGCDEIVISSAWGLGVLKLTNGGLTSIAMYQNGTVLNGYTVNNNDNFAAAGRFLGGRASQILVKNSAGIHLLGLSGGNLSRLGFIANGSRIGGWLHNPTNDQIRCTGFFSGTDRHEFVISSPWGIGILGFDANANPLCQALNSYGSVLGDWYLESSDGIVGATKLLGAAKSELLVVKKNA